MQALEKKTGKGFGSGENPLLVSVRSGSAMSMPGMMDTILNLGLNETSLQGLIKQTGNPRFAYDAYRRFIQLFGKIALDIDDEHFDERMAAIKRKYGARSGPGSDAPTTSRNWRANFSTSSSAIPASLSRRTLTSNWKLPIGAVFRSWMGKRAVDYRKQFKITKDKANGTAVNVCTMVFGNMGNDSGTGRGLHAQSRHRRERDLRRISGQRAGRGRGGGHPHAQADRRDGTGNAGDLPPVDGRCTTGWNRITTKCRISSSPSRKACCIACKRATAR